MAFLAKVEICLNAHFSLYVVHRPYFHKEFCNTSIT